MPIDKLSGRHLYVQVAGELRSRISAGRYVDRIPSAHELGEELEVSHLTVRRALELLINEGVLMAHQGRGTFVVGQPDNELQTLRERIIQVQEQLAQMLAQVDAMRVGTQQAG